MDPEIEGLSEDTYKLIDDVVSMVEKINQIQKFLGKDLQKFKEKQNMLKKHKVSNLHLLFYGLKSFVGKYKQNSKEILEFTIEVS